MIVSRHTVHDAHVSSRHVVREFTCVYENSRDTVTNVVAGVISPVNYKISPSYNEH